MKRWIIGLLFGLMASVSVFAQSTTVSGQITDASAQAWNNGTFTFTFVPSGNNPVGPYTWTGGTLATTITGSLSATGSYSVSIPSNTAISPVNSVWSAKFCPQATSACFYVNNITVTGGTQTVNATPPTILISLQTAVPPVLAYSTSEITGAAIGSQFYLLGTGPQVCQAVSGNNCTSWTSAGGGGTVTGQVVQNGLMGEYRILPTETAASLVDYSPNSRNATGTVGTAPTIISPTGGVSCGGAGAIILPASLNSALTIQVFGSFQPNTAPLQATQMLVGGNGANPIQLDLYSSTVADSWGPPIQGSYRIRSFSPGNTFKSASRDVFSGSDVISFLMDTTDRFFIGQQEVNYYQSLVSAGLQTNGSHQICGVTPSYINGKIYYVVFYNRVLNNAEVAQNVAFMRNSMAARGVPVANGATDATAQVVCDGDSLTAAGVNYCTGLTIPVSTTAVLQYANPIVYQVSDQGLSGAGTGVLTTNIPTDTVSLLRPFAGANVVSFWAGTNDVGTATVPYPNIRGYCSQLHQLMPAAKCIVSTMISRTGLDFNKNQLNDYLRHHWPEFADGLNDFAANANLGADGASTNVTYFSDGIHLTATGNAIVTAIAQQNILRATGFTGSQPVTVPPKFQALQCNSNFTASSVSTLNVAFTKNTLAGSLKVVLVHGPGGGQTINAPTDTQSGTWTAASSAVLNNGKNIQLWYSPNATAAADTITVTFGGAGVNVTLDACEYSGVATVTPVDAAGTINTAALQTIPSNTLTTTASNELLVSYAAVVNTPGVNPFNFIGSGSSTTVPSTVRVQTSNAGSGQGVGTGISDNLTGVAAAYISQFTFSGTAVSGGGVGAVSFKAAATPLATYQMTGADVVLYCNPTAVSTTISLPDAIGFAEQATFTIKNTQTSGANTCTVAGINSETIDGSASVTVANKATLIVRPALVSPAAGGANWIQVQNN